MYQGRKLSIDAPKREKKQAGSVEQRTREAKKKGAREPRTP